MSVVWRDVILCWWNVVLVKIKFQVLLREFFTVSSLCHQVDSNVLKNSVAWSSPYSCVVNKLAQLLTTCIFSLLYINIGKSFTVTTGCYFFDYFLSSDRRCKGVSWLQELSPFWFENRSRNLVFRVDVAGFWFFSFPLKISSVWKPTYSTYLLLSSFSSYVTQITLSIPCVLIYTTHFPQALRPEFQIMCYCQVFHTMSHESCWVFPVFRFIRLTFL